MSRAIDRANEVLESAVHVITSFGMELQEKDRRIKELERVMLKEAAFVLCERFARSKA